MAASPHISPAFCGGGPMARPDWRSLGRNAQRSIDYACAFLGRDKSAGSGVEQPPGWLQGLRARRPELRQPWRTLEPPRDERG